MPFLWWERSKPQWPLIFMKLAGWSPRTFMRSHKKFQPLRRPYKQVPLVPLMGWDKTYPNPKISYLNPTISYLNPTGVPGVLPLKCIVECWIFVSDLHLVRGEHPVNFRKFQGHLKQVPLVDFLSQPNRGTCSNGLKIISWPPENPIRPPDNLQVGLPWCWGHSRTIYMRLLVISTKYWSYVLSIVSCQVWTVTCGL